MSTERWGKLTSVNVSHQNLELTKDSYKLGRRTDCEISIPDVRLSGYHCTISKQIENDEEKYFIEDTSSNGTFLNNEKIGKGNKKQIHSGDSIYLLPKDKVTKEDLIGYIFSCSEQTINKLKRAREEEELKKAQEEAKKNTEKQLKFQDELGEEMQCCICIDYIYNCVTVIPCLHNFCAACLSDLLDKHDNCPQCRDKIQSVKKNATVNNIIEKFMENNPDKKRPKEEYEDMDKRNKLKDNQVTLQEYRNKNKPMNPGVVGGGGFGRAVVIPRPSNNSLFGNNNRSGGGLFGNNNNRSRSTARQTTASRGRGRGGSRNRQASPSPTDSDYMEMISDEIDGYRPWETDREEVHEKLLEIMQRRHPHKSSLTFAEEQIAEQWCDDHNIR